MRLPLLSEIQQALTYQPLHLVRLDPAEAGDVSLIPHSLELKL